MDNSPVLSLLNQSPLDHEGFAAHIELEALLKKNLRGDVRFDLGARALYAADSSNYRQLPVGVILPETLRTWRLRWPHAARPGLLCCRAERARALRASAPTWLWSSTFRDT